MHMRRHRNARLRFPSIPAFAAGLMITALPAALPAQEAADWTPPLAADGKPDISGVWDFRTLTPLQRPTDQEAEIDETRAAEIEAAAVERARVADLPSDPEREGSRPAAKSAATTTSGSTAAPGWSATSGRR